MIEDDEQAKNAIIENIEMYNKSEDAKKLLTIILRLCEKYSFVENQTYPRPSHPIEEKRKDPYYTLIAIILSLRTTLENEKKAVIAFMDKYKSISEVLNADENEMIEVIKVAGMPQKKAQTIIKLSEYIQKYYNGNIWNAKKESVSKTREELLKMPGVGDKSADCMLELGFDMPSMVVDINVFRVASRIFREKWAENPDFMNKEQIKTVKDRLENSLPRDYLTYQIAHTMILLQGKHICKSKCKCENCFITHCCNFYKEKNKVDDKDKKYEQLELTDFIDECR